MSRCLPRLWCLPCPQISLWGKTRRPSAGLWMENDLLEVCRDPTETARCQGYIVGVADAVSVVQSLGDTIHDWCVCIPKRAALSQVTGTGVAYLRHIRTCTTEPRRHSPRAPLLNRFATGDRYCAAGQPPCLALLGRLRRGCTLTCRHLTNSTAHSGICQPWREKDP